MSKRWSEVVRLALWLLFWAFVLWLLAYGPA